MLLLNNAETGVHLHLYVPNLAESRKDAELA
jgi:hypothetical protein